MPRLQPLPYAAAQAREAAAASGGRVGDREGEGDEDVTRRVDVCALCHTADARAHLMSACACHKKSDANMVHRRCLEERLNAHDGDDPLRCDTCHEPYRVNLTHRFMFAWKRVLSGRSLGHAFEFAVVLCMVVCLAFTFTMFRANVEREQQRYAASHHGQPASNTGTYVFYALFGTIVVLIPLTLHRVYTRWVKANAVAQIVDPV